MKKKQKGVRELQREMQELASEITYLEGKQSQARIGDIREILGLLSDILWECPEWSEVLQANGERRAKRRKPQGII